MADNRLDQKFKEEHIYRGRGFTHFDGDGCTPPVDSKGAAIDEIFLRLVLGEGAIELSPTLKARAEEAKQAILAILAQEVNKARKGEHEIILGRYAELYNRLSKEHGVSQPVPHTAFHQLSKERTKDLERLG